MNDTLTGKKQLIIIGILITVIVLLIVATLVWRAPTSLSGLQENVDELPLPIPLPAVDLETPPPTPVPQPGNIILDGIAVQNFVERAVREEGDNVVLADHPDYQIYFSREMEKFTLFLNGNNFEQSKRAAESELLDQLGIDEGNACRLYVEELVPFYVTNEHAGQTLPLSFCYHEHDE